MSYRTRHNGRKIDLFTRVDEIKQKLNQVMPEISTPRIISMLGHCRRYYEGNLYRGRRTTDPEEKRKRDKIELTHAERILYDFLLKNNLNPSTTYRWFLAVRVPEDIKEKLKKNKIGYKKAMEISYNRKRVRESSQGLLMMEDMRTTIRGL